jgi:hypothetical protein
VTLAAKVESKNGTEETIATTANIFERVLPEPPKRDFTLPLNGEFKDISYCSNYVLGFHDWL